MPNYKEIARLKAAGQSNRAVAEALGLARNTVNSAVARIEDSGLRFEDLSKLTDAQIDEVFPNTAGRKAEGEYYMPDFEQLMKELAKPGVTLQLLWEEYSDRSVLSGTIFGSIFPDFGGSTLAISVAQFTPTQLALSDHRIQKVSNQV